MEPQRIERPTLQGDRRAVGKRPAESRSRQAKGARLRDDCHLPARKPAGQGDADAVPHRIAAGHHSHPVATEGGDAIGGAAERALPDNSFDIHAWYHAEMPHAADQHFRGFDECAPDRREAGEPVFTDADDREPGSHAPSASALTAAAASALPPRRPWSVMNSMPRPNATSAALASAAPTKPTGKPRIRAGFGAPSAIISSRRNSAVGALPIATTAPAKCGRHSSTAAAERVVPRAFASSSISGLRKVQMTAACSRVI